jgi:DnaK suppressor protein
MDIESKEGYYPTEQEEYMNPRQVQYFKAMLLEMRAQMIASSQKSLIGPIAAYEADMSDNASMECESYTEQQTRSVKNRTLVAINAALERITNGEYGYCMESGKKVGVRRLMANPAAPLCIEEQERLERRGGSEDEYL